MTANEVEIAVAQHFNARQNIIVPNVSWGLGLRYEADLVVLRPSGFAVEVEIKVTASDIKADLRKTYQHESNLFRQVWFAVPEELKANPDIKPQFGVLAVGRRFHYSKPAVIDTVRSPKVNPNALRWSPEKRMKLMALGCMRIWTLKAALKSASDREQKHKTKG